MQWTKLLARFVHLFRKMTKPQFQRLCGYMLFYEVLGRNVGYENLSMSHKGLLTLNGKQYRLKTHNLSNGKKRLR